MNDIFLTKEEEEMNSTRIFVCHDLDLTEETQLEVQILRQLRQKLQQGHAEVVLYPERASDEGFLTFFYQQLSTCQWFILFQTESAVRSFGVQSAVSIAKMQVEQKKMRAILRFVVLPGESAELPPAWSTLPTFGATIDYQRALEELLLTISAGQAAEEWTDPVTSPSVALFEAPEAPSVASYDQRAAYNQRLIVPPPPAIDLDSASLPTLPARKQNQVILPDLFASASLPSSLPQMQANPPAAALSSASTPAIDRPAQLPMRLSKGQIWLSAGLASVLLLGVLLTIVLPLRASSSHQPGTPLPSPSSIAVATPSAWPTANRTATAGVQASATVSTQGTASAQASATASAQGTASAQASATASAQGTISAQGTASAQSTASASTPQGLYTVTTRKTPNVTDPLSGPSSLNWDVLNYGGGGGCGYSAGSYYATMPQSGFFATCMAEASNYGNFLYQVHMIITGGSGRDGGGLLFRSAGGTAYRLRVGIDGSYDLVTPAKTLASGTSAAVKTGLNQTNLVAVAAHGSSIDIYINGTLIVDLTDTTSSVGRIGLMGVDFSRTAVKVAYSDIQIWLL